MPGAPHTKLFHAIVGLGLVSAGCDGATLPADGGSDAPRSGEDASAAAEAGLTADADAASHGDDAEAEADASADSGVDATVGEGGFDAQMAADVAADVAEEVWPVLPVK